MLSLLRTLSVLAVLSATLSAQTPDLDGMWFKTKVAFKGHVLDAVDETTKASKFTVPVYLRFTLQEGGVGVGGFSYGVEVWAETEPGMWEVHFSAGTTANTVDNTSFFLVDFYLEFADKLGRKFGGYSTDIIKVKRDKEGNVKSAKLTTLGGEVITGTTDGENVLYGGQVRKGVSVAEEKLPFDPNP